MHTTFFSPSSISSLIFAIFFSCASWSGSGTAAGSATSSVSPQDVTGGFNAIVATPPRCSTFAFAVLCPLPSEGHAAHQASPAALPRPWLARSLLLLLPLPSLHRHRHHHLSHLLPCSDRSLWVGARSSASWSSWVLSLPWHQVPGTRQRRRVCQPCLQSCYVDLRKRRWRRTKTS